MKYGDYDNVTKDSEILLDIIARQGAVLLLEALAESAGKTANKFAMNLTERTAVVDSLLNEFKDLLWERL